MKFKDFKVEAPKQPAPVKYKDQTTTQQITDPGEKDKNDSKAWRRGRDLGQVGAGNKGKGTLSGIIGAVKDTGKELKTWYKDGQDKKPQVKKAEPETVGSGVPTAGKLSSDPIFNTKELKDGTNFVDEKGIQWTFNTTKKGWFSNSKMYSKPINAKQGLEQYQKAKTRTKVESKLYEAEARIQHAEDLVFFKGSAGAKLALAKLKELAGGGQEKVTIKWDGSPAVIFGRDEDGKFMLTDKGGFGAKGYDGKNKSPEAVEKMFMNRPGAQRDPQGFKALGANMKKAYSVMEKATPENFRGYFKGDMLYFNTPNQEQDVYMFKPQIVQYMVKADSKIGKRIGQSSVGVVIHRVVDEDGTESPLKQFDMFQGNDLFVIPPVTVSEAPKVDDTMVNKLEALINKNASSIDSFLDKSKLQQMKVSDFANILYSYINSKVDTGLDNLGRDFLKWLSNSKVSRNKQEKITQYIKQNINTFSAMWDVVNGIMKVKDNIIAQLDSQDADVVATINGQPGGEGYVLSDPDGDMKLVNRRGFSAANRAQMR